MSFSFFLFPGQNLISGLKTNFAGTEILSFEAISPAGYPIHNTDVSAPETSAKSAVVIDADSLVKIYGKNETEIFLPASTTKVMTALVSLDNYSPDDILMVNSLISSGQMMGLRSGERIKASNLLAGLLIASANDAAETLATNYPGGTGAFVSAMNRKAKEIGLNNTYFANPIGLDSDNDGLILDDFSYISSLDLARLAIYAMRNQHFSMLVGTREMVVTDVSGGIIHNLDNVNQLLGQMEGMRGVKTGWTEEAGECLVSLVEKNGRKIIIVVLGSDDRFGETKKLVDWVFANYRWVKTTPTI